jgi:hypothetical protein
MAQALSVVGEAGIHGMKYNGLTEQLGDRENSHQSRRMRWSLLPAYSFSGEEFETYITLAWRFGFVERSKYQEIEWIYGIDKSSYPVNDEIVRLTRAGWEYIEANDRPLLHRWAHNITENFPTFVVSVIFAVFSGWVLFVLNNS